MKKKVFDDVVPSSQFNFAQAEQDIIKFWKEKKIYHKSLEQRKNAPKFVFYEPLMVYLTRVIASPGP